MLTLNKNLIPRYHESCSLSSLHRLWVMYQSRCIFWRVPVCLGLCGRNARCAEPYGTPTPFDLVFEAARAYPPVFYR